MTHTKLYKRDVNPRFGLLLDGRERERQTLRTECGRGQRRERHQLLKEEVGLMEPGQLLPNYHYSKHTHTNRLPDNILT